MTDHPTIEIPVPVVAPLGTLADRPEYVHEVWEVFHNSTSPPSIEERLLSAILRAVHEGLRQSVGSCPECDDPQEDDDA